MIKNRADYLYYLDADRESLGRKAKKPSFNRDPAWRFHRLLRKMEYLFNSKKSLMTLILYEIVMLKFRKKSCELGLTIPLNCLGPGTVIPHYGSIIIHSGVKIGTDCRIHSCVNIGAGDDFDDSKVPLIGNRVYIGPGVKIFGKIRIADGIAIGANAVVNRSFDEPNITIGGIPARKISNKGSDGLIRKGTVAIGRRTK